MPHTIARTVAVPLLPDLLCFSHLRWDFVFQRPQHLMTRFARERRVFFIEEPFHDAMEPRLDVSERDGGVRVVVPHLPERLGETATTETLRALIESLLEEEEVQRYVCWYYTPMSLPYSRELRPVAVAYDCMDELSLFRGAPPALVAREKELLARADVVFTGGTSLYEAKRDRHPNVHCFPSSVDVAHFARARTPQPDPADQARIPHPRLGFFGVLDERLDVQLLRAVAHARPDWQLILLGPVVKVDPATLPRAPNMHYLGTKAYAELPAYLAALFEILGLLVTVLAAPNLIRLRRPQDPATTEQSFHLFHRWGLLRAAFQISAFPVFLWAVWVLLRAR